MRKISFAVAVGVALCACGGGAEETEAPKTPAAPVAAATTPPAPTAEAPKKEEKPQPSLAELEQTAMKAMGEAMNAHDAKKLAALYADNAVVKMAGMPDESGKDAIAAGYQKMFDAFSNYKGAANRVWMKDDVVVVEWAFNGTHSGDMMGIKATEKPVGAMGVDVMWFSPDGKIKEQHTYFDVGTVMSQVGVSKHKARAVPQLAAKPEVFASKNDAAEPKNVDAAKTMFGAFEKKSEADFLAGAADDIQWDDMTQPEASKGKAAAKKYFTMMTKAFPDAKVATTNAWGVGDFVIAEGNFQGTQNGPLFGMPATKKKVDMHGIDIVQFKDGKVVKGWSYGNSAEMMMQLGMMKAPAAAKADPKAAKADAKAPAKGDAKAPKADAKGAAKAPAKAPAKADAKAPAKK